jgi:3-aminobutyryl-CoA ammonia-lyase
VSVGMRASLKVRLGASDIHYGGGLVAGGRVVELLGDAATELCIRCDGDEGLLAGYSSVDFLAPLSAGDFVEVTAEITRMGTTSREMAFRVFRYARLRPDVSESAADLLGEPELVARANGTCIVRGDRQRRPEDT